ncbi:glycosyltransferase family 4 protein [Neomicrococcus lactis]|uniref:glycosyltransferase family 4 protein n=1 Tax=Neomicrococcus lactis TaxID=732241 RepID=UPI003A5C820E
MRILYVSHAFPPARGGVESFSEVLAEGFSNAGHQVRVVTHTMERLQNEGEKPYAIIRTKRTMDAVKLLFWADVVIENSAFLKLAPFECLLRVPRLQVLHDRQNLAATREVRQLRKVILHAITRARIIWSKRATSLIAVSNSVSIETGSRALVIPNGYRDDIFRCVISREQRPPNSIVAVGRLVEDKGFDLIIRAVAAIWSRGCAVSLTIVGDGPELGRLKTLAATLGVSQLVTFAGGVPPDEVNSILNQSRVFVLASRVPEAFGISILEAQAAGCAVVCTAIGGIPEAVGSYGLLVPPEDADAIALAIESLFLDEKLSESVIPPTDVMRDRSGTAMMHRYLAEVENLFRTAR